MKDEDKVIVGVCSACCFIVLGLLVAAIIFTVLNGIAESAVSEFSETNCYLSNGTVVSCGANCFAASMNVGYIANGVIYNTTAQWDIVQYESYASCNEAVVRLSNTFQTCYYRDNDNAKVSFGGGPGNPFNTPMLILWVILGIIAFCLCNLGLLAAKFGRALK